MVIEIAPSLVLQVISTGNEIHARVMSGIDVQSFVFDSVRTNERGNIELVLRHVEEENASDERFAPVFQSLGGG